MLRSARTGGGEMKSVKLDRPAETQSVFGWIRGLITTGADEHTQSTAAATGLTDEAALVVQSRWREVLEAMENAMAGRPVRHTGGATRTLLATLAEQGEAEHAVPVLEEMAVKRGKGGVLGGKLGPSAVAAVLEACARAAADRRPLHPSLQVWPPVVATTHSGIRDKELSGFPKVHRTQSTDLANHAQVAIRIAEAASVQRRYGEAAARLSPQALEWLVVACLHDTAAAAQRLTSNDESSSLSLRHVQYASLSRGMALVETLQRRLPKQWSSHHEDSHSDTSNNGTVGTGGSYAERLRWAVRTLRLLNSLCGSASSTGGRGLSSMLQDDDDEKQAESDLSDVPSDGSTPASALLAALIRSCTQSELSVESNVTIGMSDAAYAAAVAVNKDAARAPDVYTAMIEAYAHTKQPKMPSQLATPDQAQEAQQAFRVLDTMRSTKVVPTRSTFNALLSVCAVYCDQSLALSTCDMMRYHQIEPDHTTFINMIRSCGADAAAARQIFDESFATSGLPPSATVFEALAQVCAAAGELEKAVATLQELEQTPGLLATDACHDAVLLGAAASLQATTATSLQLCTINHEQALAVRERAVDVAVDTLDCMHHEGRNPGAVAVLSLLFAIEGIPLVVVRLIRCGCKQAAVLPAKLTFAAAAINLICATYMSMETIHVCTHVFVRLT